MAKVAKTTKKGAAPVAPSTNSRYIVKEALKGNFNSEAFNWQVGDVVKLDKLRANLYGNKLELETNQ